MKYPTREAVKLFHEGNLTLSRMEANGVRVDVKYLEKTITETKTNIVQITKQIHDDPIYKKWRDRFGAKTNLGSRTQLGEMLHNVLGYEAKEFTEKGNIKVSKDTLDEIEIPLTENFVKVENLKKTLGTYLNGIKREMVQHGPFWYIHPSYSLNRVSTFRSSCSDPNFQNAPKRNPEMGRLVRPNYLPHPGEHLVETDLSGAEVITAVCYNHDPVLMKYLTDPNSDMHGDTAEELFFIPHKMMKNKEHQAYLKKTSRDSAKNQFVFPQFYGSVYYNCTKTMWKAMHQRKHTYGLNGISMVEHLAKNGIERRGACNPDEEPVEGTFEYHVMQVQNNFWHKRFKTYTKWKHDYYNQYLREGGIQMLTGFAVNGFCTRNEILDYAIQGSAFHCLLWCAVEMQKFISKYKMKTKLIGEIHDSLLASVPPKELNTYLTKISELMMVELPKHWDWIIVPFKCESDISDVDKNWYEGKPYVDNNGVWEVKV